MDNEISRKIAAAKVRRSGTRPKDADEDVRVAVEWLKEDVPFTVLAEALGKSPVGVYIQLCRGIRELYRSGVIAFQDIPGPVEMPRGVPQDAGKKSR